MNEFESGDSLNIANRVPFLHLYLFFKYRRGFGLNISKLLYVYNVVYYCWFQAQASGRKFVL